ncbi:TPA: glucosyltransferase domain-containing protein [Enterobacter asburiae]|nr:glucosyltransferase domain-containing protein [Enterobacter asburiae]
MFKKDEKIFLISLSIMILLYILPIILADRLYIDDILRSQYGYKNWGLNGRPLADAVMALVNMTSGEIVDISPLPLLIACGAYVVCSLAYYKTAINFIGPFKAALLFFFVIANPFLLENLSYKFDVLPMILSVAVLLLPFCGIRNLYLKIVAGVLCVAASLSLYQASIGFFCSLALIELTIAYSRYTSTDCGLLKDLCLRVASLFAGYLLYSFIAKHFIQGDYNETHSQMIGLNLEGLQSAIDTSRGMNYQLMRTIGEMPFVVYVIALLAVLFSIYSVYSRKTTWSASRFIVSMAIITSPATVYLLSFIHLSLLKNPIFVHRVLGKVRISHQTQKTPM